MRSRRRSTRRRRRGSLPNDVQAATPRGTAGQAEWGMRVILPALMQDVQAYTRRGVPSTSARTRCTFGFQRRLFRLCEKVTALPKNGFLPQMSQTAAIDRRGYQTASCFDRGEVLVERRSVTARRRPSRSARRLRRRTRSPAGRGSRARSRIAPSGSNNDGNGTEYSAMNASAPSRESSESTPRNCTPRCSVAASASLRHLHSARLAPRGPQVHHHRCASQGLHERSEGLSVGVRQLGHRARQSRDPLGDHDRR